LYSIIINKDMNKKFDFKDISLIPEPFSLITSRSEIHTFNGDGYLPIMVSPMDTVIDTGNYKAFLEQDIEVCIPREDKMVPYVFNSISLHEFEDLVSTNLTPNYEFKVLVDIANGHIQKLHDLCKKFVENRIEGQHILMVGNVANPKTYEILSEIGVDYVRVGIGGGSGCLTSANTGIHYPMASLIKECYDLKVKYDFKSKIVADGGFRNYDDIVKAIALGADYVMLGGIFNKCLESCSPTELFGVTLPKKTAKHIWNKHKWLRKYLKKSFRGMSTKDVQRKWGKSVLRTSEGITKKNRVEYTLPQWRNNFRDYLKSEMSYTNSKTLDDFRGSDYVFITENALKRYDK
jgi:GMP reductase